MMNGNANVPVFSREKSLNAIKERIKTYPGFPKPGILFRDVFPLFHHPSLLPTAVDLFIKELTDHCPGEKIDMVVGIDSRGFLFGPELARKLGCHFNPARKKGKLPGATKELSYDLEYGSSTIEMQEDILKPGKTAVVIDDLIATGGTMGAVCNLLMGANIKVLACLCIVELPELKGREKIPKNCTLHTLVEFEGE